MGEFKNILIKIHNFFVADKQRWIERLKRTSVVLFDLSILLLPFNGLPYFSSLKEFSRAGSNYPMYLACVLVFIYKLLSHSKYRIPHNKLFHLFVIFITFISIFGGIVSIFTLSTEINNHIPLFIDIEHLLYYGILLLLFTIFSLTIYNIVIDNNIGLEHIRTKYIQSFYIPALYSVLEIIFIYTGHSSTFLQITSAFLRPGSTLPYSQLHSVSLEPSRFGIYLGGLFPWLCSYYFQKDINNLEGKLSKYVLYPFLIFIAVLTSSRATYAIILFSILVFTMVFLDKFRSRFNRKIAFKFVLYTFIITAISFCSLKLSSFLSSKNQIYRNPINATISLKSMFPSLFQGGGNLVSVPIPASFSGSNVIRIGSALSAMRIAAHYPLTGVGMGQCARYIYTYLSEAYKKEPEINHYVLLLHENVRFPAMNLLARIACDEGFLGLGIFISIFLLSIIYIYRNIEIQNILKISLLLSFCNFLLYMFVSDIFTFSEYWLILPLTWIYFNFGFFARPIKNN